MRSAAVIRKEAMECLVEKMGVIETEVFISNLLRERFDYTKWQREYFDKYSADEFLLEAVKYDKQVPFEKREP
ncbi:hypothetical protein FACS1894189_1450 [Planctomycetales bacterium]|nr:hypothetical protein FACS1894189_1450 [Planctomycetales bacterium]